ncbi:MAG: tetratricopeptide repeat protein [Bacteroidota bacterium]
MKLILAVISSLLVLFTSNSNTSEVYVEGLFDKAYATLDSNSDSSNYYAERAYAIAVNKGLKWHQANSKFIQGYVHEQNGQYGKAILLNLEAINILKNLSDDRSRKDHVKLLINSGNILRKHFKYEDAHNMYDEALKIASQYPFKGKEDRIIKIHYNKAATYREQGEFDLAVEESLKCHELAVTHSNERMMVSSWNQLGVLHKRNGFFDTAIDYYQAIIDFEFSYIDGSSSRARAYHNLANVYWELNNIEVAKSNFLKAEKIYSTLKRDKDLFLTYKDLGLLYMEEANYDKANTYSSLALNIYDKMPLELDNYQLFKNLSELHFRLGEFEQSKIFTNKYHLENEAFIENRNFIAQQSDKFKIEVVLAGYYEQIRSREQVATLTNWLIIVLVGALIILGLGYWRWKWIKSQLEIELRAHFKELAEIFTPNPSQD